MAAGVIAMLVPVRRAMSVDPMTTIRCEYIPQFMHFSGKRAAIGSDCIMPPCGREAHAPGVIFLKLI